eukprot:3338075-Rhodomonas_salina.1
MSARLLAGRPGVRLPRVVWELTGKDVLTMEFIPGLMRVRPLPRQSRLADAALDAVLEPRLDLRSDDGAVGAQGERAGPGGVRAGGLGRADRARARARPRPRRPPRRQHLRGGRARGRAEPRRAPGRRHPRPRPLPPHGRARAPPGPPKLRAGSVVRGSGFGVRGS